MRLVSRLTLLLIAVPFSLLASGNEQPSAIESIKKLDQRSSQLVTELYRQQSRSSKIEVKQVQALEKFLKSSNFTEESKPNLTLLGAIHKNLSIIRSDLEADITPRIIKYLLDNNDQLTANKVFQSVVSSGDSLLEAKSSIQFADFYNSRNQWQKSLDVLNISLEELSELDFSHASMLKGVALQNLKQHRQSIKEYQKVKPDSAFHKAAQLNIAIALLRQDWWTDAHIVLNDLLKQPEISADNTELTNRIHLMLGYSYFNKEYYRESREAFRSISLDSRYTNRAIMGLILSAIAQQDYKGALNTLTILNKKQGHDLVVEETYLLLPNLQQKLQQYTKANDAYLDAIVYFEERISQLTLITPAMISTSFDAVSYSQNEDIQFANTSFRLNTRYPVFFQENLKQLNQLESLTVEKSLATNVKNLKVEYQTAFEIAAKELVQQRVNALTSYLSQAKYGLAQLYDETDD